MADNHQNYESAPCKMAVVFVVCRLEDKDRKVKTAIQEDYAAYWEIQSAQEFDALFGEPGNDGENFD